MLTTTYRQIRNTIGEWRRRARSRHELVWLSAAERRDLVHSGGNIRAEMGKWFWQA